jgi:hypothetical protein
MDPDLGSGFIYTLAHRLFARGISPQREGQVSGARQYRFNIQRSRLLFTMVFVRLRTLVIGLGVAAFAGTALNAAIPPAGTYGFFFEGDRTYGGGATGTLTITSSSAFTGQTRPLLPLYVLPPGPIQFIYKPFTGFRGEFDESGTARVLLPRPKVPPRYI